MCIDIITPAMLEVKSIALYILVSKLQAALLTNGFYMHSYILQEAKLRWACERQMHWVPFSFPWNETKAEVTQKVHKIAVNPISLLWNKTMAEVAQKVQHALFSSFAATKSHPFWSSSSCTPAKSMLALFFPGDAVTPDLGVSPPLANLSVRWTSRFLMKFLGFFLQLASRSVE